MDTWIAGIHEICPSTAKVSVGFEQNILLNTSTLHKGNNVFLRELRKNLIFINVSKNTILSLQTISTPMPHRRKCLLLSNKVRLSAYVELVVFSGVSDVAAATIFLLVIIRTDAKCTR